MNRNAYIPYAGIQKEKTEDEIYMLNMFNYIKGNPENDTVKTFIGDLNSYIANLNKTPKDRELDSKIDKMATDYEEMKKMLQDLTNQVKSNQKR